MDFVAVNALIDGAVRDHLTDPALLFVQGRGVGRPVRAMLSTPAEAFGAEPARVVGPAATLEVEYAAAPGLSPNDEVAFPAPIGRRFRLVGAPSRPGDGRWWLASVVDVGEVR